MASLDQWEARLRPYFSRNLRLIAEIPLNQTDVEDMAAGVRASLERQGVAPGTRFLWERYPLTLLVLMSGFAAHNVEQNYWEAFGGLIGVRPHNQLFSRGWHSRYRDEAGRRGLRTFDWDEAGLRYVATIRYHGGIPAYSLPDFFERILLPTVEHPGLREVQPEIALETILRTANFVDSPVINFLEKSGQLGVEFFASCQKMARHYQQSRGEVLPPEELELPAYLVEAFAEYMESKDDQRLHLRKPIVLLASEARDGYLWLKLPEQEIPLRYAAGQVEWQIKIDNSPICLHKTAAMIRQRQDTLLTEILLPLDNAPSLLQIELVSLSHDGDSREVLRTWKIRVRPEAREAPLLAFLQDGRMVSTMNGLPAETLTLLLPADANLEVEGSYYVLEDYGPMTAPWEDWQMQVVDLSSAWAIRVVQDGSLMGGLVPVKGQIPLPELVGGYIPPFAEQQLYIGDLPSLKIPLRNSAHIERELSRWRIHLASKWDAWPDLHLETTASSYFTEIKLDEENALLPLAVMLGSNPIGSYTLHVSGPGDIERDFSFRVWPKLTILNLPKVIHTDGEVEGPVKFNLRLPDESTCEPQAGSGDIQVEASIGVWEVIAGPSLVRAQLNLIFEAQNNRKIHVPVSIPIPRMRRAVTLDNDISKLQWSTRLVQKSSDAFLQSDTSALHVEMYGLRTLGKYAELQLVSFTDESQILQAEKFKVTPFSKDWLRVSLNTFRDTFNHASQQGRFDFVLPAWNDQPELRIPLAIFSRKVTVLNLGLDQVGPLNWQVTWDQQSTLKNRRIMLVTAWQPWQIPLEYKIPDSAGGRFDIENTSLPKTRYHLYFYTAPSWYPIGAEPPADIQPVVIDLVPPEQRLDELSRSEADNFKSLFETACIYDSLGNQQNRDLVISEMAVPFTRLTNLQILLSFLNWLIDKSQYSPYTRFFFNNALNYDRLNEVLSLYPPDNPQLRKYLSIATIAKLIDRKSAFQIADRSEDPAVINACLRHLLAHEDDTLILLVLEMIRHARLSTQDAIDVLSEKADWALNILGISETEPDTDRLIAGLLPRAAENNPDLPLVNLISRALPYIQDESYQAACIDHLFSTDSTLGTQVLFSLAKNGMMPKDVAQGFMKKYPEEVYAFLGQQEPYDFTKKWIVTLSAEFPHLAGEIRPNTRLQTPLGVGVIDYIVDKDGNRISKALLRNRDCRINLLIGEGGDRFRTWLDLSAETISFSGCQRITGCGHCGFMHPEQKVVARHIKDKHHGRMKFRMLTSEQDIDLDQIKILS